MTGNATPVLNHIRGNDYAIAADRTLVYLPSTGPPASSLVWVDREGTEKLVTEDRQDYVSPRISPDGTRIAIVIAEPHQGRHVWIYDVEDDSFRRLTDEGKLNQSPVWTPDGQWITFSSIRDGQSNNLYRKRADGRSGAERLTTSQSGKFPSSWSPDGNVLAFNNLVPARSDIWILRWGQPQNPNLSLARLRGNRSSSSLPMVSGWPILQLSFLRVSGLTSESMYAAIRNRT